MAHRDITWMRRKSLAGVFEVVTVELLLSVEAHLLQYSPVPEDRWQIR